MLDLAHLRVTPRVIFGTRITIEVSCSAAICLKFLPGENLRYLGAVSIPASRERGLLPSSCPKASCGEAEVRDSHNLDSSDALTWAFSSGVTMTASTPEVAMKKRPVTPPSNRCDGLEGHLSTQTLQSQP
jgi:hypothetical protein